MKRYIFLLSLLLSSCLLIAQVTPRNRTAVLPSPQMARATFQLAPVLKNGTYAIYSVHSNKALRVFKDSKTSGAPVVQWGYDNSRNSQKWQFTYTSSGAYRIQALHSKLCLDNKWSRNNGSKVVQASCSNGKSQLWYVSKDRTGKYIIRSAYSGLSLDISGWSRSDGGGLQQHALNRERPQNNQRWRITPVKSELEIADKPLVKAFQIEIPKTRFFEPRQEIRQVESGNTELEKDLKAFQDRINMLQADFDANPSGELDFFFSHKDFEIFCGVYNVPSPIYQELMYKLALLDAYFLKPAYNENEIALMIRLWGEIEEMMEKEVEKTGCLYTRSQMAFKKQVKLQAVDSMENPIEDVSFYLMKPLAIREAYLNCGEDPACYNPDDILAASQALKVPANEVKELDLTLGSAFHLFAIRESFGLPEIMAYQKHKFELPGDSFVPAPVANGNVEEVEIQVGE
jgi:hypothetical protein